MFSDGAFDIPNELQRSVGDLPFVKVDAMPGATSSGQPAPACNRRAALESAPFAETIDRVLEAWSAETARARGPRAVVARFCIVSFAAMKSKLG
jgi:hypothetical protein